MPQAVGLAQHILALALPTRATLLYDRVEACAVCYYSNDLNSTVVQVVHKADQAKMVLRSSPVSQVSDADAGAPTVRVPKTSISEMRLPLIALGEPEDQKPPRRPSLRPGLAQDSSEPRKQ